MKAILLVRVSTKAQDFDEQEREIYNMAIKDGYLPECIIPICEKESGIKLAEEERAGLNKMKELIEEDNDINCVYCWEVSRIARRKKINFSVLDYLTTHKIQLVVKNPSIRLFKDNGDIDGSTSTAVYANGLYPYFTVDFKEYFKHTMQSDIASENCSYKKYQAVIKNLPTYQLSIPLENIDAEKFEVISVLNSILTCETLFPTESGQSVFDDSFKSAYSVDRGPKGVSFNNIDYVDVDKWDTDDTGYLDYFSKSDCYSVYTAKFSFDYYN